MFITNVFLTSASNSLLGPSYHFIHEVEKPLQRHNNNNRNPRSGNEWLIKKCPHTHTHQLAHNRSRKIPSLRKRLWQNKMYYFVINCIFLATQQKATGRRLVLGRSVGRSESTNRIVTEQKRKGTFDGAGATTTTHVSWFYNALIPQPSHRPTPSTPTKKRV